VDEEATTRARVRDQWIRNQAKSSHRPLRFSLYRPVVVWNFVSLSRCLASLLPPGSPSLNVTVDLSLLPFVQALCVMSRCTSCKREKSSLNARAETLRNLVVPGLLGSDVRDMAYSSQVVTVHRLGAAHPIVACVTKDRYDRTLLDERIRNIR
jgi:hypothetical protein